MNFIGATLNGDFGFAQRTLHTKGVYFSDKCAARGYEEVIAQVLGSGGGGTLPWRT